jgi:uncharacterized protein YaiL (DUF2058 family)
MGNALRDQLLKAGLVSENQVKKAVKDKRKEEQRIQGQGRGAELAEAKRKAQQAQAEKIERDRQLNAQRQEQAAQKALAAQARQLIEANRQPKGESDTPYNFVDGGKVKRLYANDAARAQIVAGLLGIARLDKQYELVPRDIALKIRERDAKSVVVLNDPPQAAAAQAQPDDPYAQYQVPDDLIW